MVPGVCNFTMYRGSTFVAKVYASTKGAGRIDLSQYYDGVRMHIRPGWQSKNRRVTGSPLVSLTTANGKLKLVAGEVQINLSAAEVTALPIQGCYDMELYINAVPASPGVVAVPEIVDKLLRGTINVIGEKTI